MSEGETNDQWMDATVISTEYRNPPYPQEKRESAAEAAMPLRNMCYCSGHKKCYEVRNGAYVLGIRFFIRFQEHYQPFETYT